MAELNFDANSVDPGTAPTEIITPGWYTAQIVASELRPTKNGLGQYLELEFDILDGQFQGRKIWDRLNLQNANQQAVEIANRTLSRICHSVGVMHVQNSEQLHFKPVQVKVAIAKERMRDDGTPFDPSNEIKGYKPLNDAASTASPAAQVSAAPAAQAAPPAQAAPVANRPPWEQSKAN